MATLKNIKSIALRTVERKNYMHVIVTVLLSLLLASNAYAQTNNSSKKSTASNSETKSIRIGFVDPRKIMETAPQAESALIEMEKTFEGRRKEIISMRESIKAIEQELASSPPNFDDTDLSIIITNKKIELRDLRREYVRKQDELKEDINLRRNDELARLQTIVRQTIHEIAEEQKYDLILEQAVFVADQVDITNLVIDNLKIKFESNNAK